MANYNTVSQGRVRPPYLGAPLPSGRRRGAPLHLLIEALYFLRHLQGLRKSIEVKVFAEQVLELFHLLRLMEAGLAEEIFDEFDGG